MLWSLPQCVVVMGLMPLSIRRPLFVAAAPSTVTLLPVLIFGDPIRLKLERRDIPAIPISISLTPDLLTWLSSGGQCPHHGYHLPPPISILFISARRIPRHEWLQFWFSPWSTPSQGRCEVWNTEGAGVIDAMSFHHHPPIPIPMRMSRDLTASSRD